VPNQPIILSKLNALTGLLARRDYDNHELLDLFAADVTRQDHRAGLSSELASGRSDLLNNMKVFAQLGLQGIEAPVLETRGDTLALVHNHFRFEQDFEVEFLQLCELDEHGRIAHLINFDASDVEAAIQELDRRWEQYPQS